MNKSILDLIIALITVFFIGCVGYYFVLTLDGKGETPVSVFEFLIFYIFAFIILILFIVGYYFHK